MIYYFLNYFFYAFHSGLILFNTFGWIIKKLRFFNLIALSLTALSWFGLGIFYGWGYCFCTDWHWKVREKLGYFNQPNSYMKFLLQKITGIDLPAELVDAVTLFVFILSFALSLVLNIRDYKRRKHTADSQN